MITTKGSSASTTAARVYGARPMDFSLTDEQQLIRETAREFAHKVVRPRADENARKHHFDVDLAKQIAEQGYLGAIIPRDYGGGGLGFLPHGVGGGGDGAGAAAGPPGDSRPRSPVCCASLRRGTAGGKKNHPPKA